MAALWSKRLSRVRRDERDRALASPPPSARALELRGWSSERLDTRRSVYWAHEQVPVKWATKAADTPGGCLVREPLCARGNAREQRGGGDESPVEPRAGRAGLPAAGYAANGTPATESTWRRGTLDWNGPAGTVGGARRGNLTVRADTRRWAIHADSSSLCTRLDLEGYARLLACTNRRPKTRRSVERSIPSFAEARTLGLSMHFGRRRRSPKGEQTGSTSVWARQDVIFTGPISWRGAPPSTCARVAPERARLSPSIK